MYQIIVREKKWVGILGTVLLLFASALTFLGVRQGMQNDDMAGIVVCGVIGGAFILLGMCLILDALIRELALGYQECRYRTMFGKKKYFTLRDIAKIETKNEYIFLLDASGKKIVRFENNMDQAAEAVAFIQDHLLDEYGRPKVEVCQKELSPSQKKELEKNEKNIRKIREKVEAAEKAWSERPLFYETPEWRKRLRVLSWILNLGGFAILILNVKLPITLAMRLSTLYPLVIWLFWLCFHRVMVWGKNRLEPVVKRDYVQVPFYGAYLLFLVLYDWIYPCHMEKVLVFGILFCGALLVLMLVITHTPKGWLELVLPIVFLFLWFILNIYHWPVVLHTGEPRHTEVRVLEKETETSSRRLDSYYFQVQLPDGRVRKVEVYGSVYRRTEEGDMVELCINSSLLGDYCYVHGLEDDCEWIR